MIEEMAIGEIVRITDIPASTIRYYERMHVLPTPCLVNKKRRYTADIFAKLTLIKIAQMAGLTVAEMRVMLDTQPGNERGWRELARQKLVEVEQRMQQLAKMKRILEEGLSRDHLDVDEAIHLLQPLM